MALRIDPDSGAPTPYIDPAPEPGTSTYELTLQREAVARALAGGLDRDKICAYFNLTPNGLRALEQRDEVRAAVARHQERFQIAAQMNSLFMEKLAPSALENIEDLLGDRTHKEWGQTSRWVIDQVRGGKSQLDGGLSLHIAPESVNLIGQALIALAAAKAGQPPAPTLEHDPHLIDK